MAWENKQTRQGVVWMRGSMRVMRVSDDYRPWFASRGFMMLGDKRRNVRRFGTPEAAMKAADAAERSEFWA